METVAATDASTKGQLNFCSWTVSMTIHCPHFLESTSQCLYSKDKRRCIQLFLNRRCSLMALHLLKSSPLATCWIALTSEPHNLKVSRIRHCTTPIQRQHVHRANVPSLHDLFAGPRS